MMDPYTPHRGLRHMDSQDTFVSLVQLEPIEYNPIEYNEKGDYYDNYDGDETPALRDVTSSTKNVGAVGLNTSGHGGSVYYLARIQKYSSYAFTVFTTIHVANTAIIPLLVRSVPASETYLIQAREIYQSPLAEALVVALPIATHVVSGLALRLVRRAQNIRRYGANATPALIAQDSSSPQKIWPPFSWISTSGYWLLGFTAAHVAVNRVLPVLVDGDSSNIGLAFVAHGFARHPAIAHAAYIGLVGAGCAHMVWGMARWSGVAPSTSSWWGRESHHVDRAEKKRRRRRWMAVNCGVLVVGGVWAAGGLGVVARGGEAIGWVGDLYDGLYSRVWLS